MPASSSEDAACDSPILFLFILARALFACAGSCSACGAALSPIFPVVHTGSISGMAAEKHVPVSIDPAIYARNPVHFTHDYVLFTLAGAEIYKEKIFQKLDGKTY
jgi:hypothetical protein